jgi:hypothetical protein
MTSRQIEFVQKSFKLVTPILGLAESERIPGERLKKQA